MKNILIENTIKNKHKNYYYINNPQMFNKLLDIIKNYRNIKCVLQSSSYRLLFNWINEQVTLLQDPIYDILTKVYWILKNICSWQNELVICPNCKQPFYNKNVKRLRLGYPLRCSIKCMNKSSKHIQQVVDAFNAKDELFWKNRSIKSKQTKIKNGHTANWTNYEKCKQTKLKRHNNPTFNNIEKARTTRYRKNNGKWHNEDFSEKVKATSLKNNGYESALSYKGKRNTFNIKEIRLKALNTLRKNCTYNKSKQEDKAYEILCNVFNKEDILRQYLSDKYPYSCDFYIKSIDTYIEFNGHWTHGKHAYNKNSIEDQSYLEYWINKMKQNSNKQHNFYKTAIYVWTKLDVNKRNTAKQNNLNFVEVWTITQLNNWLSTVKYIKE